MSMSHSSYAYKSKARDCSAVRMRMREIALNRVHYGCERVFVVLRREGWRYNHKRIHRIYKEEGLSSRHCRPRRSRSRSARRRQPIKVATAPNALWGMDFVSDALFDGRRFRSQIRGQRAHLFGRAQALVVYLLRLPGLAAAGRQRSQCHARKSCCRDMAARHPVEHHCYPLLMTVRIFTRCSSKPSSASYSWSAENLASRGTHHHTYNGRFRSTAARCP